MSKKLVQGVGVNDADYVVDIKETIGYVNGKRELKQIWICPFYQTWKNMLTRGYSSKYKETHPTYQDVFVNEEWHLFSNFKNWMQDQRWQDEDYNKLELDKDILFQENKEYSKDKCIFVPKHINQFLVDRGNDRGEWPLGVTWDKRCDKFQSRCCYGKGKYIHLGYFTDPQEAHLAWKECKHKLALQYANELEKEGCDSRLVEALRIRYI